MAPKVRKVPLRRCVGCDANRPKRELVRIVRTPEGALEMDPQGKRPGRGVYVCPDPACLEAALRGRRIERALEAAVPPSLIAAVRERIGG